jgi:hypothetical protein
VNAPGIKKDRAFVRGKRWRWRALLPNLNFRRIDMMKTLIRAVIGVALMLALWSGANAAARADVKNYEFKLVQTEVKKGDAEVAVTLVDKTTGKPLPNAVIFAKRIDMAPDGMEMMDSPIEAIPSREPGVYRFKTSLGMAGRWQLSLGAKVQGEEGTVENKLVVKVLP